jgi:hypothetical protein
LKDEALMRARLHNDRRGARLNGDDPKALAALYGTFDPPTDLSATIVSPSEVALRWKDNTPDPARRPLLHSLAWSAAATGCVRPSAISRRPGATWKCCRSEIISLDEPALRAALDAGATACAAAHPEVETMVLFGSFARGDGTLEATSTCS